MRVLHVITGLSTGGAERALYNVLAGGSSGDVDSVVLSLERLGAVGSAISELGVPVYTLGMSRRFPRPDHLVGLRRIVSWLSPDLVQGWMYHGNLAASVAGRLARGQPAVAWNVRQSLYEVEAEKPMTRQVIRANRFLSSGPDAILYNSQVSRTQHESFGFRASRAVVIPNGFDLERLQPDRETAGAVRRELDLPPEATVIGHVARFHPTKDHASFLWAAVQVARVNPTARFLMVGREVSPENPALAGIVPPDCIDRFVFTGERSDVHRLMQAMDVFCLNSWSEAFPNVLGEAMACGVPCVATDVGDSAAIVGDTGIVVPPSDTGALAGGLEAMVQKSAHERQALGRAARQRIKANYSLDSVVAQYTDLYQTLSER